MVAWRGGLERWALVWMLGVEGRGWERGGVVRRGGEKGRKLVKGKGQGYGGIGGE